jgi:hypothetical protein
LTGENEFLSAYNALCSSVKAGGWLMWGDSINSATGASAYADNGFELALIESKRVAMAFFTEVTEITKVQKAALEAKKCATEYLRCIKKATHTNIGEEGERKRKKCKQICTRAQKRQRCEVKDSRIFEESAIVADAAKTTIEPVEEDVFAANSAANLALQALNRLSGKQDPEGSEAVTCFARTDKIATEVADKMKVVHDYAKHW